MIIFLLLYLINSKDSTKEDEILSGFQYRGCEFINVYVTPGEQFTFENVYKKHHEKNSTFFEKLSLLKIGFSSVGKCTEPVLRLINPKTKESEVVKFYLRGIYVGKIGSAIEKAEKEKD